MKNETKPQNRQYSSPYELDGKLPLKTAIPLGMQHVFAMYLANLMPLMVVPLACGIPAGSELHLILLQNAVFVSAVVTLVQCHRVWKVGAGLPIVMCTSGGFQGINTGLAASLGGTPAGYSALLGAWIVGGLFEGVIGWFMKPLRKFFPSVVTGVVVLSIGLSLIGLGIKSYGGGPTAADFASLENLFLATVVLLVIVVVKHSFTGMISMSSVLIGIVAGYITSMIMSMVLPTTMVVTDAAGVAKEITKSWVLNWETVRQAGWFAFPRPFPMKITFSLPVILPMCIMFIVTAVETTGHIAGVARSGLGREATDLEMQGGIMADGLGSSFAALFAVPPNTSVGQNVGIIAMTKVVNRYAVGTGACFMILCSLCPKLAAIISIMPQSVLGGAMVMLFASIVISGIQLIAQNEFTSRIITILAISIGLGYGMGSNQAILANLPEAAQLIFGGSGIVPTAMCAIILNLCLPKDKAEKAASEG